MTEKQSWIKFQNEMHELYSKLKTLKKEYPDIYKQVDDFLYKKFDNNFYLGLASQSLAEAEDYCMDVNQRLNYGEPVLTAANIPEPSEAWREEEEEE